MILHAACQVDRWHLLGDLLSCRGFIQKSGDENVVEALISPPVNNNEPVKALNLFEQKFTRIPRKLENFYPQLLALSFFKSDINVVSKYDLESFPHLQYLGFRGNKITTVPGDLFEFVPDLRDADFSWNPITSIGPQLLNYAPKIKYIHFFENTCTNFTVNGVQEDLPKLVEIIKRDCK